MNQLSKRVGRLIGTGALLAALVACAEPGPVLQAVPDASGIDSQATELTQLCLSGIRTGQLDQRAVAQAGFSPSMFNQLMRSTDDGRRITLLIDNPSIGCSFSYGPKPLSHANVLPVIEAELERQGFRPVQSNTRNQRQYSDGNQRIGVSGSTAQTSGSTFVTLSIEGL